MSVSCGLPNKDGYNDVYATEHIVLGKKSYIDNLEYVNVEGQTIHDQHVLMNGFLTSCIEYYANDNKYQYYMFIITI